MTTPLYYIEFSSLCGYGLFLWTMILNKVACLSFLCCFKLDSNKTCGDDKISAEHLMHASERILHLLAMCITGFFVHGFLPDNLISVILIQVIKQKNWQKSTVRLSSNCPC